MQLKSEFGWKWNDFYCGAPLPFICELPYCNEVDTNSACFKGKSYNITGNKQPWGVAKATCEDYGGTLVIINSEDVYNFILKLLSQISRGPQLNDIVSRFFQDAGTFGILLQFFAVHSQLIIIIGLCMDDGHSLTAKFLRTKIMQFLGRISLSLYLIHWSLMGYITLAINGKQHYDSENKMMEDGEIFLPTWSPLILIIISPIIAFIITKYFEEPIGNILKGTK